MATVLETICRFVTAGLRPRVADLVSAAGLTVEHVADHAAGHSRWLMIGTHCRTKVDAAVRRLGAMHRIETVMFRRMTNVSSPSNPPTLARTHASRETSPKAGPSGA